jgi:hypothetical protein
MVDHEKRFGWLCVAEREFRDLGAPATNLVRADRYWEEALELVEELILDQYTAEDADIILNRVSAFDVAFLSVALALQERSEGDGWYEVAVAKLVSRYDHMLKRAREQRSLPNVRLSLRGSYSDADPGL